MKKIIEFKCKESFLIMSDDMSCTGSIHEDEDVLVCHLAERVSVRVREFNFIIDPAVFGDKILPNIEEVSQ